MFSHDPKPQPRRISKQCDQPEKIIVSAHTFWLLCRFRQLWTVRWRDCPWWAKVQLKKNITLKLGCYFYEDKHEYLHSSDIWVKWMRVNDDNLLLGCDWCAVLRLKYSQLCATGMMKRRQKRIQKRRGLVDIWNNIDRNRRESVKRFRSTTDNNCRNNVERKIQKE